MIKLDINQEKKIKTGEVSLSKVRSQLNRTIGLLDSDKLNSTIEIFFVSKEKIKKINRYFRRITQETDVLSFPQNFVFGAKENILGTIFISPEVAEERSESIEELIEHGALHLLGFDHEKKPKNWQYAIDKLKKGQI